MKYSLRDLGIFDGKPAFKEKLYVGRPNIGDRKGFFNRVNDLLDRKWLTNNGPYVQEFQQKVADFLGIRHCIAICNGTVALEIAIRALELKGEVIVPSFTFIATAHALQWQAITPVFCDIDPKTHNIDPDKIEKLITPRTTGIIGVHLWGRVCDIESLKRIAKKHDLKLLYDASHAFGCSYNGKMVGNFGNAEIFSFHATKFVNTFEGGAIVTNDTKLAGKIRLMKNFGFAGYDKVIYIGTNGKMSEISAAMGLTGLESMNTFIGASLRNYKQYKKNLGKLPGINLCTYDEREKCNYQYVILEIDESVTGISRDSLIRILWAENILARRYFFPGCHRMEPYISYFPNVGLLLPETESLSQRVISLPTGTSIGKDEINTICHIIRFAVENGQEITNKLKIKGLLK